MPTIFKHCFSTDIVKPIILGIWWSIELNNTNDLDLGAPHILRHTRQSEHSRTFCLWQAWDITQLAVGLVPDLFWCSATSSSWAFLFFFTQPESNVILGWQVGEGESLVAWPSQPKHHLQILEVTGGFLHHCLTHLLGMRSLHQMSSTLCRHHELNELSFFSWLAFKCHVSHLYSNVDSTLDLLKRNFGSRKISCWSKYSLADWRMLMLYQFYNLVKGPYQLDDGWNFKGR